MDEIKQLEQTIQRRGFVYRQMYNGPEGYVYSKSFKGAIISYEAFRRKVNTYFDCISFPGDEAFGLWAWDCKTLASAQDRLGISLMPV